MKDNPIVMGFDDAMHDRFNETKTQLIGVVCQGVRMVNTIKEEITIDGTDSTDALIKLIKLKKKHVQYVITDTITFGGFNIMDMKRVHQETNKPIIAIIDREIDLGSVRRALEKNFPTSYKEKLQFIVNAGELYQAEIYTAGGKSMLYFHAIGIEIEKVELLLKKICIDSKQPECTRLAHLIGRLF